MPAPQSEPRVGRLAAVAVDAAVAVGAFAGTVAVLAHGGVAPSGRAPLPLDLIGVLLAACSTLPLVAWRRSARAVFIVCAAGCAALAGLGYPMDLAIGPAVSLYLLAAGRDRDRVWATGDTVLAVVAFAGFLAAAARWTAAGLVFLHSALAWAVAWFAGERTRLRRGQVAELRARVAGAEREVERERLLAVAEERARIARDLHDSAGHAMSVIAVRAGAARLRHFQEPEHSLATLSAVEQLARDTIAEIDRFVGSLRDRPGEDADVDAPPGLSSLPTLVAHHEATGIAVRVAVEGDRRPLSGGCDQAAYRILQEALRNAGRHGFGAAEVRLTFSNDGLDLTVTNRCRDGRSPTSGGGHGLIGMRERAVLTGGSLDAGRSNGVFHVHAHIPYGGSRP